MGSGGGDALPTFAGEIRVAGAPGGAPAVPGTVTLEEAAVVIAAEGAPPRTIAYRDLSLIAINGGVGMLVAGEPAPGGASALGGAPATDGSWGSPTESWLLGRFGQAIGPLVATLRERRLRQRLADAFVEVPDEPALDLVEYATPGASGGAPVAEAGVALLALDPWGVTLAPLDERLAVRRVRRADISLVEQVPEVGGVRVTAGPGSFELRRLGMAAIRFRDQVAALPAQAHRDAGAILAGLIPDLPTAYVGRAAAALVDGRPASPADLGPVWEALEAGRPDRGDVRRVVHGPARPGRRRPGAPLAGPGARTARRSRAVQGMVHRGAARAISSPWSS